LSLARPVSSGILRGSDSSAEEDLAIVLGMWKRLVVEEVREAIQRVLDAALHAHAQALAGRQVMSMFASTSLRRWRGPRVTKLRHLLDFRVTQSALAARSVQWLLDHNQWLHGGESLARARKQSLNTTLASWILLPPPHQLL
jgi:reverse gyrase